MEIKGKNIIVTGGLGCLGSGIVAALEEKGANIIIFDCVESETSNTYMVDVTNMKDVRKKWKKLTE